jgi:hypothetical protein
VALTTQIRDLLRDNVQNPLPHHRTDPILKNPFEILIPGLLRAILPLFIILAAGWFHAIVKKQAVLEHRPINQHYFILTL